MTLCLPSLRGGHTRLATTALATVITPCLQWSGRGPLRGISTSGVLEGKKNFRKFPLGNKRGPKIFRKQRNEGFYPDIPIETEVQPPGYSYGKVYNIVPEMVPQFIVPDLTECELKPYVSYRAGDSYQEAFTAKDLYEYVYLQKLGVDFKEGGLDKDGNPLKPSPEELMTPEKAWTLARQTGSDIFSERIPKLWECLDIDVREWRKEKAKEGGYEHFSSFMREPYDPNVHPVLDEAEELASRGTNNNSHENNEEEEEETSVLKPKKVATSQSS